MTISVLFTCERDTCLVSNAKRTSHKGASISSDKLTLRSPFPYATPDINEPSLRTTLWWLTLLLNGRHWSDDNLMDINIVKIKEMFPRNKNHLPNISVSSNVVQQIFSSKLLGIHDTNLPKSHFKVVSRLYFMIFFKRPSACYVMLCYVIYLFIYLF